MRDGELSLLIEWDYDAFVEFMQDYANDPFDEDDNLCA